MGKTFISADNVDGFICRADQAFYVEKDMVLTPGAKDKLKNQGISIIYGPRPEARVQTDASAPMGGDDVQELEKLVAQITGLLKTEYQVTDPDKLAAVVSRVVAELLGKK